jgi:hypothetical protein
VPSATLRGVSLAIHQLSGVALLVLAVFIAVLTILARSEQPVYDKALVFRRLAAPLVVVIVLTGAQLLIAGGIALLQFWVAGALMLILGYMGTLDGAWAPTVRRIRELEAGADAEKLKAAAIGLALAMVAMLIAAAWLMQAKPG